MAEDSQIIQKLLIELSSLKQEHVTLQGRMADLAGQAGNAHSDLERRLGEHLDQRLSQQTPAREDREGRLHIKPVQPQRFKGNGEGPRILDWLHQAEQYVKAAGIENTEKGVWHITSFLERDAAVWWRLYSTQAENGLDPRVTMPKDWRTLRQVMEDTFREVNHEIDIRDRYVALRQTASVAQYITRFRAAIVELPDESETSRIYWFLRGLKTDIQAQTRTHKPKTLMAAMDIADEADRASQRAFKGPRQGNYGPARSVGGGSGPAPMQLGAVESDGVVSAINRSDNMRLRQENRCFLCRKVGHQQRQCPRLQGSKKSHGQGIDETQDGQRQRRKQAGSYRRKPVN